jgi:hypothetical protein
VPDINCFQALDYFQTGRAHLLLVTKTPGTAGGALGVITLEGELSGIAFLASADGDPRRYHRGDHLGGDRR